MLLLVGLAEFLTLQVLFAGGPQLFESVSELDASVTSFPDEELAALCAMMYDDSVSLPVEASEIVLTGMGAVEGASDQEDEETVTGLAVLGIPVESWPAPTSAPPSPPRSPVRSKRPGQYGELLPFLIVVYV